MYNNEYNRHIATQLDKINKHFIKHQGEQGMAPYAKGEGMSGGGFSLLSLLPFLLGGAGKPQPHGATVCHHCKGSGMLSQMLSSFGFGKEHPRHMDGEGISGSGLLSGLLGSFGFGEPHPKKSGRRRTSKAVEPVVAEGLDGSGLLSGLLGSFGLGHPKKRGRPRKTNAAEGAGQTGGSKRRGNPALGKRAAIVKQIMHEQGLGMIAASKYVKTHNLY